jgi:hypothetical protein
MVQIGSELWKVLWYHVLQRLLAQKPLKTLLAAHARLQLSRIAAAIEIVLLQHTIQDWTWT